jgi:hypothetical protein
MTIVLTQFPGRSMSNSFRPGEKSPCTGLFKAIHADHAASHEVTILFAETFPFCLTCRDAVRFELTLLSVHAHAHPLFVRDL